MAISRSKNPFSALFQDFFYAFKGHFFFIFIFHNVPMKIVLPFVFYLILLFITLKPTENVDFSPGTTILVAYTDAFIGVNSVGNTKGFSQ